jgi:hypothetical protein
MPKKVTKKSTKARVVTPQARTHIGRVNQKMIDQMITLRRQGFTHADIGHRLGASPRTVRRHTEGVSPQLVHAEDQTRVDLLQWGALQMRAIQQHWHLTVKELDFCLKGWRNAVTDLDDMTVEQLERETLNCAFGCWSAKSGLPSTRRSTISVFPETFRRALNVSLGHRLSRLLPAIDGRSNPGQSALAPLPARSATSFAHQRQLLRSARLTG